MNTPDHHAREPHKILHLIGALIIAIGCLMLLNRLIGPEAPVGTLHELNYQRMQLPETTPPAVLIET
jgi:hypothetical protein